MGLNNNKEKVLKKYQLLLYELSIKIINLIKFEL